MNIVITIVWTNLEVFRLCEINQIQKVNCNVSHMESKIFQIKYADIKSIVMSVLATVGRGLRKPSKEKEFILAHS